MATRRKKSDGQPAKLLSTGKVLRVLVRMNADPERFMKLYAADTSRGPRTGFSKAEMTAIEAFLKARQSPTSVRTLMEALETKSIGTAMGKVLRYQEAQEQGSQ
ncbi:MAG: hypothetical protein WEF50_07365 [Myxococcota bacterium]